LLLDLARKLEAGLGHLARLFYALAALALFMIVAIIVASVVMRRLAGSPLYYTEELVGLLLSSTLFLALPMVTKEASHVRVTFLASFLAERGRAVLAVCAGAVMLAFCGWFLLEAIPWIEFAFKRNIKSEAASLRLGPWMAVLPVSMALCGLLVVVRVITGSEKASFDQAQQGE
jgi:TRAP-type C4-dicarboxylate transport system permease small subunit